MFKNSFYIGKKKIGKNCKTYFIADIASNHDGSLSKAKDLIFLAAKAGADAAKFQNFTGKTLINDKIFKKIGSVAHQSEWSGSVFEVYDRNKTPIEWTEELKKTCKKAGIEYFTSPYDLDLIKKLNQYVAVWKVGSGDITWHESISIMSKTKKPIILATGASNFDEVKKAVGVIKNKNKKLVLMQCNTNYTASEKNFKFINLNVLKTYKKNFPNVVLGLSDHTPGHSTVLGAIALGAKVVEKHFTNKNSLGGPDHKFSMNPASWKEMVLRSRELEDSLGKSKKIVEKNENETVKLQRRAIYLNRDLKKGSIIKKKFLVFLRPCPSKGIPPYSYKKILNKKTKKNLSNYSPINLDDVK